jgi:two-component sensor histidine kinase
MANWLSNLLGPAGLADKAEGWPSALVVLHAVADGVIAVCFVIIPAALLYIYVRRGERRRSETVLLTLVVLLSLTVGLVHLASLFGLWVGVAWLEGLLKAGAALLALATVFVILALTPRLSTAAAIDRGQREANEDQLRLLLRELTHRSKNLLAVIQAIARQTASRSRSMDDFLEAFSARLVAMGRSHDILIADDWQGASLRTLVEQQLQAQSDGFGERIVIEGDDISLKPEAVQNLGLALHELASNAQRYGALSSETGCVRIHWHYCRKDPSTLRLVWQEEGGPPVTAPKRHGFGRAMIENVVAKALAGEVTLTFPAEGVRCVIDIPAQQISARD